MLAPMSWIKRFTDINVDADKYCNDMIMTGSEVEGYTKQGEDINKVVVGRINKIIQHENADRLKICCLDIGVSEDIQIVTGADNVFEGAYVPVALGGAILPNGLKIKKGKLRGIESFGMLCSGEELNIDDSIYENAGYDGIMILKGEHTPGMKITEAIDYDDIIIDFKTYANRPDTLSVIGLARETSATYNLPFVKPCYDYDENEKRTSDFVDIIIQDKDLCPRYIGKIVYDIKIEPSPLWMQKLLSAADVRPINNIVDITNFVMLETGQPMHAFDFKYVKDNKIIVRRAKDNEEITTLDGKKYKLSSDNLVIADGEKPIAIAGIMGGENSCIYNDTKVILFESANFNSYNIRRSSRKLGLRTESSSRYEKGIDPAACERGINRAMHLFEKLGAGKIAEGMCDINYADVNERIINVDFNKINILLGQKLTQSEMKGILKRIFIDTIVKGDMLKCTIPTYRSDLGNSADIAEEIMRLYGYDKIPSILPSGKDVMGGRTDKQKNIISIRNMMISMGLFQSMSYSFMSPSDFTKLNLNEDDKLTNAVKISNPMGEDYSLMRTTLVPSMLTSIAKNKNHNISDVKLFELDRVFLPIDNTADKLPAEIEMLCIGINSNDEDFYTLKGRLEVLFEGFNLYNVEFLNTNIPYLHPGRGAQIKYNDKILGYVGEVHPDAAENYQVQGKTIIAEINISILICLKLDKICVNPIPKYPAIPRDLAVLLDADQNAGPIISSIKKIGGSLLESAAIFDVYQGSQIEEGKKSVAFSLVFRSHDRTLVDEEVNDKFNSILQELEKTYNAKLRM